MSSAPPETADIAAYRFLADLNISPQTVEDLRQRRWDITRSSHWLPSRAPDENILDFARNQGFVVVTQDLDFSALLALGGHDSPSLVTLRLSSSEPAFVTRRLLDAEGLLARALVEPCAVTIEDSVVRIRKLPIR
jgi:predicted nuclease of predicted toxin-antitoxin system